MVILRFKIQSKPDKSDEVMAALAEIITPARATEGVISLDIARVLNEPDSFIATVVYEDAAALERQESRPEVHKVVAILPDSLAAPLASPGSVRNSRISETPAEELVNTFPEAATHCCPDPSAIPVMLMPPRRPNKRSAFGKPSRAPGASRGTSSSGLSI